MKNIMHYKGYIGSVEFSEEDAVFFGKVQGIRALISYEGENAQELIRDFRGAVDTYLSYCEKEGRKPEVAFKGSFNVRVSPELHRKLFLYSEEQGITMNRYIEQTLETSPAAKIEA